MEITIRIILFTGIMIYFSSRWLINRKGVNCNQKRTFFSFVLVAAEIMTICVIVSQLFWNIATWKLPLIVRIAGLILFISSTWLSVHSRLLLSNSYSTARKFAKPKQLIRHGPYKYIRHPIYSGTLVMGLGFELALQSYLFFIVLIPGTILIYILTRKEEAKLENWFPGYKQYRKTTKRLIPFIF